MMPQSMNKRVCLDMRMAAPARKDSYRGNIFDLCVETRKRALRMNEGQDLQLQNKRKILDRNKREIYIKETKKIHELDNSVKNLNIYKKVLENFNYDKLVIVKKRNKDSLRNTVSARKRINAETKILHSGFSVSLLKPQMEVISRELDPKQIRLNELRHEYIVSKAQSDITLTREGTFSALLRDYRNKSVETETTFKKDSHQNKMKSRDVFRLPRIDIKK